MNLSLASLLLILQQEKYELNCFYLFVEFKILLQKNLPHQQQFYLVAIAHGNPTVFAIAEYPLGSP